MNIQDFREIALSLKGAEESSHMGNPDFRVGGRIFATLASQDAGFGNLMLTTELQNSFILQAPDVFLPVHDGWGRMGITHIRLSAANETQLVESLRAAWTLGLEKNNKSKTVKKNSTKKKS
jgi:hypothetical protein